MGGSRIVNINTSDKRITENESQGSKGKEFKLANFEKVSQKDERKASVIKQKTERYKSQTKYVNDKESNASQNENN